jgi:hypothetical protein
MKKLLTILVAVSFGSLAVVARVGTMPPVAVAAGSCIGARTLSVASTDLLNDSSTIAAAAEGDAIALVRSGQVTRLTPPEHGAGMIRHVSLRPGVGTTYVRDRAGGDVVVAQTPDGVRRFRANGEALNPSFSATGDIVWAQGAGLRIVAARSDAIGRIAGPVRLGLTFSPRFDGDGTIVAGIVSPPTEAVPGDERLSNLWRYDFGSKRWTEVTRFSAGADQWSVVRTPFVAPDGSMEFVRVHGRASVDREPTFELWQVRGAVASKVRSLPGEMYLAGFDGPARLWNLREAATGSWRIDIERRDGTLRQVGCGAVAVDPLDHPDPDRRVQPRRTARASRRVDAHAEQATPSASIDQILVGDFSSSDAANDVAARIRSAFGSSATVIDSTQAPTVVRPGVWAVIVPLSGDPEGDLARFREALPDLADWSWIVSL